jgi:hypothetical protein
MGVQRLLAKVEYTKPHVPTLLFLALAGTATVIPEALAAVPTPFRCGAFPILTPSPPTAVNTAAS